MTDQDASVFGYAQPVGDRIDYVPGMVLTIPEGITHILARPLNRKGGKPPKIFLTLFKVDYQGDYKPKNNTGKYFCCPPGVKRCRVIVDLRPSGWNYEVEWLAE